jgi:DNA-binding transcriptional LysR family regulator
MSNSDSTLFERLAKLEPAKLARLVVELAAQDQTILEQVQLLLASGDTTAIAKAVRSTLRAWWCPRRWVKEARNKRLISAMPGSYATAWIAICVVRIKP